MTKQVECCECYEVLEIDLPEGTTLHSIEVSCDTCTDKGKEEEEAERQYQHDKDLR